VAKPSVSDQAILQYVTEEDMIYIALLEKRHCATPNRKVASFRKL
jgi:hypothetical protein